MSSTFQLACFERQNRQLFERASVRSLKHSETSHMLQAKLFGSLSLALLLVILLQSI